MRYSKLSVFMTHSIIRLDPEAARSLLGSGLETEPDYEDAIHDLDYLAARLSEWRPLLELANGFIRYSVSFEGCTVRDAILRANRALDKRGFVYFNVEREEDRADALAKMIEACLKWLSSEEQERFAELAALPADTPVSMNEVKAIWSGHQAEFVCAKLRDLRLISEFDGASIRIDELIHDYLKTVRL